MNQTSGETKLSNWSQHLILLALLLFLGGLAFILVSENGFAIFVIGGTAVLIAHVAAFTGIFMLGGTGLTKLISRLWQAPADMNTGQPVAKKEEL